MARTPDVVLVAIFMTGAFAIAALWLVKSAVLMEVIKLAAAFTGGGGVGYAIRARRGEEGA